MTNRVMLLFLLVAMATRAFTEEADEDRKPTEEEVKEVVFALETKIANDVVDAVNTINEVFHKPPCVGKETDHKRELRQELKRRALSVKRRGWDLADVAKGVVVGAGTVLLAGKRSSDGQDPDNFQALKRRTLSVRKRGWTDFLAGSVVGKGAAVLLAGKRSEEDQDANNLQELKARSLAVERRAPGWIKALRRVFGGKRSSDEEDPSSRQAGEVEFRADVEKLRNALKVLNEVLVIATMSETADSKE